MNPDKPLPEGLHPDTLAVRVGIDASAYGENSEALYLTSCFVQPDAATSARRFAGEEDGYTYSRTSNPSVTAFERRLAALEGSQAAIGTASGMSAILLMGMGLLKAGDHVVCSRSVFGSTMKLFASEFAKFGVETTFVSQTDVAEWRAALKPNTKLLFAETPTNPLTEVCDIAALAALAHDAGALLAVDNCFATPVLQKPLALGADLVIHSGTKYLDGQGRCVGGAVVGDQQRVGTDIFGFLRTAGPTLSPFNAWVFLKGLETLKLRMHAHSEAALQLATWLETQPAVERVYYPGLPSHPQHALAKRQQSGFGGIVSFDLRGGKAAAWALIDATRLISITANLGDAKSTITHPATTTHGRLTPQERAAAGIGDGLVRISAGLEDVADLQADLERGLRLLA